MTVYAAIDTNVLVSSMLTKRRDSPTARVIDAVASGGIVPLYNEEIMGEYEDVLRRPKFPFTDGAVRALLRMVRERGGPSRPVADGRDPA